MPLTNKQIEKLEYSIHNYSFPQVYYDFDTKSELIANDMMCLENVIREMLTSSDVNIVKKGLANIIYWGNANAGYQLHRVEKFIQGITNIQILGFQALVREERIPTLLEIKKLKMPQYSGVSFVSKIIAFLDPDNFCVLDLLLSRLKKSEGYKAIHQLKVTTQIGITANNSDAYNKWCYECLSISDRYFNGKYRAVDIERGYFNLIQRNQLALAQEIYSAA